MLGYPMASTSRILHQRAPEPVDKISARAKPVDISVEQPTKFDLTMNLITAKALGPHHAADAGRPRRRGDRIRAALLRLLTAAVGTFEPWADVRSATAFEGNSDIDATSPTDSDPSPT